MGMLMSRAASPSGNETARGRNNEGTRIPLPLPNLNRTHCAAEFGSYAQNFLI